MHKTLRISVVAAAAACLLFTACHGGTTIPNQVLTKPSPAGAPLSAPATGDSWTYRQPMGRQGFVIDQRAVISIRTDTSTRTDSIASHAAVSFIVAASGNLVAGSVAEFLVASGGRPPATPAGLTTPFAFRAELVARGVQLEFTSPRDATPCASLALASAQSLRDLWFRPPDTLRVGTLWQDSSSYVVCRDGVPLRTTAHRTFRVVGTERAEGRTLFRISRLSQTAFEGSGEQFGESVTVVGAGSGQLTYVLDAVTCEVLSASGGSTLDLSLRSRLRTQAVHQAAEIHIGQS